MKSKPILALLLILLPAMLLFSACSTNGGDTSAPTASSVATAAVTQSATQAAATPEPNFNTTGYPIVNEPVTYTAIVNQNPLYGDDWSKMELYAYMEEKTNVKIEYSPIPNSDWDTKLNLTLASGELPDFFYSAIGTTNIQKYGVQGGMFLNYADLIPTWMPNLVRTINDVPELLAYVTMNDGGIYCLPYIVKTATVAGYTFYFRRDMLDEVGVDNPKTIDELYDACVTLKDHYGADFSPVLPTNINTLLWCLFPAFGDAWSVDFGDQGDGVVSFNQMSDQYYRCLEFLNKLYEEGLLENEIFTMDTTSIYAKVKDGKACFINAGTQLTADYFDSGKIEVEINPPMTSQWTDEQKISNYAAVSPNGMIINAKCENPEILLRWADIYFDDTEQIEGLKGGVSMWLGIKGVNWNFSDDGKNYFRIVPDTDLSEEEYKLKYVSTGAGWGNLDCMLLPVNNPTQEMKATQSLANYFPYTKFCFPNTYLVFSDEEANRLATLWTDISTYVNNSRDGFISGTLALSGWDEYVSTLEKMGIGEVLTLKQAAYDRFNAALGN